MHEFKLDDKVKWIEGKRIYCGDIVHLTAKNAVVRCNSGWKSEEKRVPLSSLIYLPPLRLNRDEYRELVRMEIDPVDLVCENSEDNVFNAGGYVFTVEDLLAALEKIRAENIEIAVCSVWLSCIYYELWYQSYDGSGEFYSEKNVMRSMLITVCDSRRYGFVIDEIDDAIDQGRTFLLDRAKPITERTYPLYKKELLLEELGADDAMRMASEEKVILYRHFAEELAAEGNEYGLRAVGYSCYGGNRAFPCDWVRSRDCILKLFEAEEDDLHQKAVYADTLGYIYYYGRCNGGEPEYELAYKYFSFAAFNGIYEARYKIADMFRNGYGVPKSSATADNIIFELYDENLRYVKKGEFGSKFADVALRMGAMYDTDDETELFKALYYYTQAEFAIRMRRMHFDYFGDDKVFDNITNALAKLKNKMGYWQQKSTSGRWPWFISGEIGEGRKLDVVIKKRGEGSYRITFSPHINSPYSRFKKMFITVPELGTCGLYSKISVSYKADTPVPEELLERVLVVDEVDEVDGCTLRYDGADVIVFDGKFILKNSGAEQKKYRFVSVSFGDPKLFDYLCDDPCVTVGDTVLVNGADGAMTATVYRIFEKNESEMALPLKAYKPILGKAEE